MAEEEWLRRLMSRAQSRALSARADRNEQDERSALDDCILVERAMAEQRTAQVERHRLQAAEVERDRLRQAVEDALDEHAHAENCLSNSLSQDLACNCWRAALAAAAGVVPGEQP